MPGRAELKRAGIVLALIAAALAVSACASQDHSWRGEFDARLEGAATAIEERAPDLTPDSSQRELFTASQSLAHTLAFKYGLIKKLNPPDSCEEVQEAGRREVGMIAQFNYDLLKNLTPYLKEHLRRDVREQVAELRKIEAESKSCA
jgi:hypothetical protein